MMVFLAQTSDGSGNIRLEGKDRKDAIKNYNNGLNGYQKHGKLLKLECIYIEHVTKKKKHDKVKNY